MSTRNNVASPQPSDWIDWLGTTIGTLIGVAVYILLLFPIFRTYF